MENVTLVALLVLSHMLHLGVIIAACINIDKWLKVLIWVMVCDDSHNHVTKLSQHLHQKRDFKEVVHSKMVI